MNKKWFGVGAALLLGGCASVEMAKYTVTSFAEVPIKDKAKVKVVAGNDFAMPLATALEGQLKKGKALSVVEDGADYYFCISGNYEGSALSQQKLYVKSDNDYSDGGREVLTLATGHCSSAAQGVSVSVYETSTLSPVYYMEVPLYDGDCSASGARASEEYAKRFAEDAVERIMDVFVTQKKEIETKIPLEADAKLRSAFKKCDYSLFDDKLKVDLDKVSKEIADGTYKGEAIEKVLANYTLYLLVKEVQTNDPEKLLKIKDEQLKILEICDADGLAESIPVALARLEYKLANIGE